MDESLPANGKGDTLSVGAKDQTNEKLQKAEAQPFKTSTNSPSVSAPTPSHGDSLAWLQVIGSFFLWFNTWGLVNAFGVYQTYYQIDLLSSSTPSAISWIGSLQVFLLMFGGFLIGPIYDRGYARALLAVGSFFLVFGQMMLSLCDQYWQVILAQGLVQGIGCGLLFLPAVAILSTWFTTRLVTASGISAAGSGLGGVIYPIVFYRLEPRIGFGWATRVIGFIALATLTFSVSVMKAKSLPPAARQFFDLGALRNVLFNLTNLGTFFLFTGLYIPLFYLELYAIQSNFVDERLGFYLLPILNVGSVFGRVIPNYVADFVGALNTAIICGLITATISFCLIAVHNSAGAIAIAIFYGFFSGAIASLSPMLVVHATPERRKIGTWLGMGFAAVAIGLLIGNPISGAILRSSSFKYAWLFSGLCLTVGSGFLVAARIQKGGMHIIIKV
ncbi:putative MFS monocarboxylate transporter [Polyplosphaeria fusca]|uniref:MFS monocarboxylate transporter n=1 Tax=Polyplosphaeria fusca TaxID=682080 RepID=A0A9P4V1T1_9PLEO|nr:putative MFS monocarboxylate transporter [Polyplosphaeria fusca]